jgi:hypothetical protein
VIPAHPEVLTGTNSVHHKSFQDEAPLTASTVTLRHASAVISEATIFRTEEVLTGDHSKIQVLVEVARSKAEVVEEADAVVVVDEGSKMKPFTSIASIFLLVISTLHILRIVFNVDIVIDSWSVPFWINGVAAVITAVLAIMLRKENKENDE